MPGLGVQLMRIAVTGASGLVGSHVVEEAVRLGYEVKVLVRPSSQRKFLLQNGAEIIEGDLRDCSSLRSLCQGVDVVVNCAARVGDWGLLDEFRKENVDSLRLLLDEASIAGVRRVVHVSSLGVYPAHDHHGTDEAVLPAIDSLDAYTRSKTEAEILLLAYVPQQSQSSLKDIRALYGTNKIMLPYVADQLSRSVVPGQDRIREVVVLRPGFIYGRRDRTVLPKLMAALRKGHFVFFGDGNQALNAVHASNVAQAVFLAVKSEKAPGEVFNLTDGCTVSKRDFVGEVASAMNLPVPSRSIPLGLARILSNFIHDFATFIGTTNPPLINKARFKFLGLHLDYSIEKAKCYLGYAPDTNWRQRLKDAVLWQETNAGPN